jgi:hypothetical protein
MVASVVLINVPLSFYAGWKVASIWLNEQTREKMKFLRGAPQHELANLVSPEKLHILKAANLKIDLSESATPL